MMTVINRLTLKISKNDIIIYRIMALVGMFSMPAFAYLYSFMYRYDVYLKVFIIVLLGVYILFMIATFIKKLRDYLYLMAVVVVYLSTLYFVYNMVRQGFELTKVLTLAIAISALAIIFKSEKMMKNYFISMLSISILAILIWSTVKVQIIISILILVVWPVIIYYMLKSKFVAEKEIVKGKAFLEMVFKTTKDPEILIDCQTDKVVDCSESTIVYFGLPSRALLIGCTIREINQGILSNVFQESTILEIEACLTGTQEILIGVSETKYLRMSIREFSIHDNRYMILSFNDITREKIHSQEMYEMAYKDELTQISNRRKAIYEMDQLLESSDPDHNKWAVVFIDIDKFKEINDTYGHDCGDQLLMTIAKRLKGCINTNDLVARIGGDEFMLLIKDVESDNILTNRVNRIMSVSNQAIALDDTFAKISLSIGIAMYPANGKTTKKLLRNADWALYHSKQNGRNQYSFYDNCENR